MKDIDGIDLRQAVDEFYAGIADIEQYWRAKGYLE